MAIITLPNVFIAGQILTALQLNQDFQTIYNDYNGNITNANISSSAGITLNKLSLNPGSLAFNKQATGNITWASGLTTDTQPSVAMTSDGWLEFGPGGSTAPDVYFKRSAATTIQLNPAASTLDIQTGTLANVGTANITTGNITNVVTGYVIGNFNPPPTTGTLTGEYWTSGNWTTTGTLTFNHVRLHVGGNITISNPITVNTELGSGQGLGSGFISRAGTAAGEIASGQGGSYGGVGGQNGYGAGSGYTPPPGTYSLDNYLGGSGGQNGDTAGAQGGAGGGGLYIECNGNVTINQNITANGAAGVNVGANIVGGGGSGGAIDIRCLGTATIAGGVTLSAQGGAGGTGAGSTGGGGGGGGCIRVRCNSLSNSGTITVAGGAAGTGANAGATGFTDVTATPLGPRMN